MYTDYLYVGLMLYVQYNKALHVKRSGFQLTEKEGSIKQN
jgi:hypothetical protein